MSIENVQLLQQLPAAANASVGVVRADEKNANELNRITTRTLSIDSPYGDYAKYLQEALRADLTAAGRLDPNAARAINAILVRNRVDASGFKTGEEEIAARFTVTRGASVLYDKEHSARHTWESSVMGSIAAMRAIQNYSVGVQKLLRTLFSDPAFADALTK